ncbi:MAG: mucoidy inhibitor MuiA family protein [Holophagaceae bacterium]
MRRSTLPIPALFGLSMILAATPRTSLLEVEAPIRRVRLHPDEAWVTRIGRVAVAKPGTYQLRLTGLPEGLTLEDVRVSAKGPAGSRLGDVSVGSEPLQVTETQEFRSLKDQQTKLLREIEALESEQEACAHELVYLKGLQAVEVKELSARLAAGVPSAEAVLGLGRGIKDRMAEVLTRERALHRDLVLRKEELGRVGSELARRASEHSASPAKASLEVSCPAAGDVQVEFTYRTRSAAWKPAYEARLTQDGRMLEFVLFASVTHRGNEDWADVEVEVTSARSQRNVTLDRLNGPQWVSFSEQPPPGSRNQYAGATVMVVASSGGSYTPEPPPPAVPSSLADMAPGRTGRLEESKGLATTWMLEGRKDLPADGDAHRFRIASVELAPELGLLCIPRTDPTVYRVARFPVPRDLPLFPGSPVTHFAGTQRVGQGLLEVPSAGRPMQLGFGPFEGVRVALHRLEARKDTVGTFSKETQWTVKDRLDASNDLGEALVLDVQDAVLKAEQDRIRISPLPESTPPTEEPIPGVRQWRVLLPPSATRSLLFGSQIRVPMGGWVRGLGALDLPQ